MAFDRPAHPQFVPPNFIHAIVVTTAIGNSGFVEIMMRDQRTHRVLSAADPPHTPRVRGPSEELFRGGFHPSDAIGEASIGDVFPADIMKRFAAMRRAHAVDLNDNKRLAIATKRGILQVSEPLKRFGHVSRMWTQRRSLLALDICDWDQTLVAGSTYRRCR